MILFMTGNTDNQKENGINAILYDYTTSYTWSANRD